jgi:hypothetical protein
MSASSVCRPSKDRQDAVPQQMASLPRMLSMKERLNQLPEMMKRTLAAVGDFPKDVIVETIGGQVLEIRWRVNSRASLELLPRPARD